VVIPALLGLLGFDFFCQTHKRRKEKNGKKKEIVINC